MYPAATQQLAPDGGSAPIVGPGKSLALLAYLAFSPGRSASREFLLDLLWADMDGDRARHALRQTVWQLRQLLGEAAFEGRDEIHLSLPVQTDRDQFLAAVEAGDLELAVSRYTGHFLPGFAAPGGAEFEQWADGERDHLRSLFIRSASTLARRHLAKGAPREAVKLARRIREAEPYQEGGWRLLLESFQAANDRVQVLVEADALDNFLRMEGREPEAATVAALRKARQAPEPATGANRANSLVAELVGRELEFSSLTQAWEQARRGPATQLLLTGPAGLGKTRLLHDFHARLRTIGARTVLARANPGERDLPFALVADLAGALGGLSGAAAVAPATAAALVGLNPALSAHFGIPPLPTVASDQVLQRTIAIAELIGAVAYEAPVAILVDDMHWADTASRRVLQGIQSRISTSRVLLVTTTRPGRGLPSETRDVPILPLAPLTLLEAGKLISSIARPPTGPDGEALISAIWRASGGAPLHMLEALQQVLDAGFLALDGDRWTIVDLDKLMEEVLQGESIAGRVLGLDRPAAYVLTLLATAGAPCSTDLLARAAAREGAGLTDALHRLERRGFIVQGRGGWEPAHDEIAAAALEVATPEERHAAHRAAGSWLSNDPTDIERMLEGCRHFAAAGAGTDLRALFGRVVVRARIARDPRSVSGLAAAALGDSATPSAVAGLATSIPLTIRFGLHSRPRQVGVMALTAILILGAGWMVRQPVLAPDATLVILTTDSSDTGGVSASMQTIGLQADDWRSGVPLQLPARRVLFPDRLPASSFSVLADGTVIYTRFIDNASTDDIYRWRPGQEPVLVTGGPRDEAYPTVAPDLQQLAFITARWSPEGADDYDLAVLNLADSSVRRLTEGSAFDHTPAWSPAGSVLAFSRTPRELTDPEVCWVTLGPERPMESCQTAPSQERPKIIGFADDETVLLVASKAGRSAFFRWHLPQGRFDEFWSMAIALSVSASPDGRWIACLCSNHPESPPTWQVIPTGNPNDSRPLNIRSTSAVAWQRPAAGASVRLALPAVPALPVGTSRQLTFAVRDDMGKPIWLPHSGVGWSVADTSIAAIDATGRRLRAIRPGQTVLRAFAGGHLRDSATVMVTTDTAEVLFEEKWEQIDGTRWRAYGEPRPRLVRHDDGTKGLNNGGDGVYSSGVYSTQVWQISGGLGVELPLTSPLTRSQWQSQSVGFRSARSTPLDQWDRRTGGPPERADLGAEACSFQYPNGEGLAAASSYSLILGMSPGRDLPADSTWQTGDWHRVRLQLFPDGSCGLAVDGIPMIRTESMLPMVSPYRLWLSGNSADTDRLLFGPLTVWRGVRMDIDWSVLDSIP